MYIRVETLTQEVFSPFGIVLGEPTDTGPNIVDAISNVWLGFSDLMGIGETKGKQVTYLKIIHRPAAFEMIEKHTTSAEAFIPLEGQSILLVVPAEAVDGDGKPDMGRAKAFLMDGSKGVLLHRSTWHAVPYNLTAQATYLVLVDDAIMEKDDIIKVAIEPVEFSFTGESA